MKRAAEMTGAEVDRWLAARGLTLGAGRAVVSVKSGDRRETGLYVVSLTAWGEGAASARATGAAFSEALGRVMALWDRENAAPRPGPGAA